MMKSAKICPFTAALGLYLISNSLSSIAHFISLPEVYGLCSICFIDIRLGLRRRELGSKVGVSWMWLPMLGLTFLSFGTFLLPPSELDYNSRLVAAPYPILLPGKHLLQSPKRPGRG